MTHSPICPAQVLVEPGGEQDWLCGELAVGEAPGLPEFCLHSTHSPGGLPSVNGHLMKGTVLISILQMRKLRPERL